MKNLIIVESPTKARTLSRFLGKGYSVEATMGHIKDLPKSKLSVDVDHNFVPNYEVKEERIKEIKKIQDEAKKAKIIFLAPDPDREGEAIAEHVYEILCTEGKHKIAKEKIRRIVFHEITKEAVEKAIGTPGKVNKHLVDAQIARRVLDRLVGYKLSPILWKKIRRGLSAGRVQSVVVRLIVEKEREIEAFKADEYWEIFSKVQSSKSKVQSDFVVKLTKINDKKAEVRNGKTAKEIVSDLEKSDHKVSDVKKHEVKKSPYPPFKTSTMTQSAARFFHWSAKKTMSVAQKLYEEGLITYHRTDSVHLAESALKKVQTFIQKEYGDNYLPEKPRFYKTKSKVAQEAHEAVRPTDVNSKFSTKGGSSSGGQLPISNRYKKDAEKLYGLIWKRFVACQMESCVFDATRIDVIAQVGQARDTSEVAQRDSSDSGKSREKAYLLRVSGSVMKFDGWRKVIPLAKDEEPELPQVEKDEALQLIKVLSEQKFTQPPARFNEASLIKMLEQLGIGRPSTYAPTISTIQYRNYVEKEEGRFKPTSIGLTVNDFLFKNFPDILDYDFTAEMEQDLDHIANGDKKWTDTMGKFYKSFEKKVESVEEKAKRVKIPVEKLGRKCPECKKGELVIRTGRFGKFISCSDFPECKHTEKLLNKIGMKCPDCISASSKPVGDIVIKTTRKRRKFFGCSNYPKCEYASWKDPRKEEEKKNKKGWMKKKKE